MKNLFLFGILGLLTLTTLGHAQVPDAFSYQAVVRSNGNELLQNQTVTVKATILRHEEMIFTQTQTVTTNENGLLTLTLGNESFQEINWLDGPLFIKTEIDPNGGNNYTIETETQLLTVPYAMAAKTAETDKTVQKIENPDQQLYLGSDPQPYQSYFGEEYTKWYVSYFFGCGLATTYLVCKNCTQEINDTIYQRIIDIGHSTNITDPGYGTVGFFREEHTNGRLYLRTPDSSSEFLVSDMSWNVGDSVRLYLDYVNYYYRDWDNIIITTENIPYAIVKDVYYKDGLKHISTSATFFNPLIYSQGFYPTDTLRFIETIGSNISPMLDIWYYNHICTGSSIPFLTCYESDFNLVHLTISSTCLPEGGNIKSNKTYFEIIETLNNGLLTIFFENDFRGQVTLFDLLGRTLYSEEVLSEPTHTIDVSQYLKGFYILHFRNKNGGVISKKIIIF